MMNSNLPNHYEKNGRLILRTLYGEPCVHIVYNDNWGSCDVNLAQFIPTSRQNIKKLMSSMVKFDVEREDVTNILIQYLEDLINSILYPAEKADIDKQKSKYETAKKRKALAKKSKAVNYQLFSQQYDQEKYVYDQMKLKRRYLDDLDEVKKQSQGWMKYDGVEGK